MKIMPMEAQGAHRGEGASHGAQAPPQGPMWDPRALIYGPGPLHDEITTMNVFTFVLQVPAKIIASPLGPCGDHYDILVQIFSICSHRSSIS